MCANSIIQYGINHYKCRIYNLALQLNITIKTCLMVPTCYIQRATVDLTESGSGSDSDAPMRRTAKRVDDVLSYLVSSVVHIRLTLVQYY